VEHTENALPESDRKQVKWTGNNEKQAENVRKNFLFALVRMRSAVRIRPAAPTCIDKKDADENPALRCGIFASKQEKKPVIQNNKRPS
jgi:hypothetical protein